MRRSRIRLRPSVPVLALALASAAAAQDPRPAPAPGSAIRVTDEGGPRILQFRAVRGDTLVAEGEGVVFAIPVDQIERLEMQTARSWSERGRVILTAGAIGGLAGAVVGGAVGLSQTEDCEEELFTPCELEFLDYAGLGSLIGAGAGLAVGAIISSMPRWTTLPPDALVVGPGPATGGLEMKLRLSF